MRIKKWTFPARKAARYKAESDIEGHPPIENWVLWVRAEDLPSDFPLDPNARHPDTSGRVPKAIERTLLEAPAEFIKRNSGICLVARVCEVRAGVVNLALNTTNRSEEYEEGRRGDGIVNGGHTYAVLKKVLTEQEALRKAAAKAIAGAAKTESDVEGATADTTADVIEGPVEDYADARDAIVRLEIQVGLLEEDLADISRARNLSSPVEEISLRNLGNVWAPIKKELTSRERMRFAFMEGDNEAPGANYDVGDLVRLMVLFNSKLYPLEEKDPVAAFTSEKSLITRWNVSDFEHILPNLPQFLWLHDQVALTFPFYMGRNPGNYNGVESAQDETMFELMGGAKSKYKVPISFTFPILGALRAFLDEGGKSWAVSPEALAAPGGAIHALVKDALRIYREMGKSSIAFFGRNRQVWETLRMKALLLCSRARKNGERA